MAVAIAAIGPSGVSISPDGHPLGQDNRTGCRRSPVGPLEGEEDVITERRLPTYRRVHRCVDHECLLDGRDER